MTPKRRDKYILNRVKYWRKLLEIPDSLSIKIKYLTNNSSESVDYAEIDLSMYEYGKVTIKIYDEVFASKQFEKDADESVFHEMLHLFFHPLTAYCSSMFGSDEGKKTELERIEELLVSTLERNIPRACKR